MSEIAFIHLSDIHFHKSSGNSADIDADLRNSILIGHAGINETAKYLKFSNELFPESIDSFGRFMSDLLPEVDYEE